jgi:DNA-binding beta-propeller fold protein YncE
MAAGTVAWHGPVKTLYRTPPNAALMRLLGPGLWVEPPLANALGWPTLHAPCALRPWELEVRADATSPWTLLTTHDAGLFREVRLRHSAASIEITVPEATRPNAPTLGTGTRVRVTPLVATLLSALLLIIVAACEPQPAPKLKVRSWETFQLPAEGSSLPTARSLACARDGRLAALDTSGRVLVYSPSGLLLENWRMLDSSIGKPEGLVWMSDDTLMVCDTHYNRVVRFSGKGDLLGSFGRKGKGPGEFGYPVGIARDPQDRLYVCEYGGNDRVQRFDRNGTYLGSFGSFGVEPGQFQRPSGLVWADGKILVADAINNRVSIFTEDGTYIGVLGGKDPVPLRLPYDITTANLPGPLPGYFIIEYGACRLTLTDANGRVLGRLGSPGRNEFEFSTPWGVASDNTGTVYIADTLNRRIVKLRIDE